MNAVKVLICGWSLALSLMASAAGSNDREAANVANDIQAIKRAVLELNKDLYALEEDLLSPATTRAAFYFSLAYGEFFEPLSVEISAQGMETVQHIYTERQVAALRMGAVQPLAQLNIGPGNHLFTVVLRGVDHLGQNRELVIRQEVEKTDQPLLMEILVSDKNQLKSASAELRKW